jgi:serine protease Do
VNQGRTDGRLSSPPRLIFGVSAPSFCRAALCCFCLFILLSPLGGAALPAGAEADVRRDAAVIATEKVLPSVVNIATETVIEYHDWYDELLREFYGARSPVRQQKSVSLGSGVIIDEEGYILTNFHVVRRATRIQIKLWDGREFDADPIVATEGSDVALLRIRCKPGEKFKAIKLAADDDLLLGETVLALGNPFGLGGSVTKGILSSKNRRPARGDEPLNIQDWLQTDAAINPGNSGGPLVNLRGELIGLNVAVYRPEPGQPGVGVGFSIPVKQVSAALSHFFTPEVTGSVWFGAELRPGSGPLAVRSVQPGSPAEHAGLKVSDKILEVNGVRPADLIECNDLLTQAAGSEVKLLVSRERETRAVKVHLVPFQEIVNQKLGARLTELSETVARRLGITPGQGMVVEEVEKGGPLDRAQIRKGYVVAAMDGQKVPDLRSAISVLTNVKKGDSVNLSVIVPRRIGSSYLELRQGTVDVPVR